MRTLILFLAALIIAGCQSPTSPASTSTVATTPHYAIVKNSLWQTTRTVALDTVARSASNPTYAEIQAQVDSANALSLTSQEWVYLDVAPDITNAPNGNVFFVRPDNGMVTQSYLNLTRQYIVDNYQGFAFDAAARNCVLYVDHVPAPPILAKDTTPYEWYSNYIIDTDTNTKLYEDHAGYNADETWSGQWITTPIGQFYNGVPGGGWADVDAYFYQTTVGLKMDTGTVPYIDVNGIAHQHVQLITSQIWPPLPAIITAPVTP